MSDTDDILLQILSFSKETASEIASVREDVRKVTKWMVEANKDAREIDTNLIVIKSSLEAIEECQQRNAKTIRNLADNMNDTMARVDAFEQRLDEHERRLHGPLQANGASNS